MRSTVPVERGIAVGEAVQQASRISVLRSWLMSWEVYLIVAVAGWLRLYGIGTTEFDDDQAAVFRMAYHAVSQGHLVATSNIASIHIYNPPAVIYFFMLPAAFSSDPLWGAVMVGVLMTLSVLLTYVFVRRYYRRVAATIAALLYAVAARPIFYSRFIWNQNLLPILTILLLFALFRGVVECKKGWLGWAIFVLGLLVQLHASGILMVFPLGLALLLAPKTLRWRDALLGCVALIISSFPYLLWEVTSNFVDVRTLLAVTKQPVFIDNKAWTFYQLFLSPYDYNNPPGKYTLLGGLVPVLSWTLTAMTLLVVGGVIVSLVTVFWSRSKGLLAEEESTKKTWIFRVKDYVYALQANSYRGGLFVLLIWQIVPLLLLTRHSIELRAHYIIILMPGPFIFIGLFVRQCYQWLCKHDIWSTVVRACIAMLANAIFILTGLLIIAQFAGSTAGVLDTVSGNFDDKVLSHPYYNDLHSLQNALHMADVSAQQFGYRHIYISSDPVTQAAMSYLGQQMRTPTTVVDCATCIVIPSVASGPAIMLIGPYSPFTEALLQHFDTSKLLQSPMRLGGAPFKMYVVNPLAYHIGGTSLSSDLQLLRSPTTVFTLQGQAWNVTPWRLLRSAQPSYQKVYWYSFAQFTSGSAAQPQAQSLCGFTSMQAGDTLLVATEQGGTQRQSLYMRVQAYTDTPYELTYEPVTFDTYKAVRSRKVYLRTVEGKDILPVSLTRT